MTHGFPTLQMPLTINRINHETDHSNSGMGHFDLETGHSGTPETHLLG